MSTLALFSELSDKGLLVRVDGPDLVLSPKGALTPEFVRRIKREKPVLLRELEKIRKEAGTTVCINRAEID